MSEPIRIANASGFYGDRFAALREQLEGGRVDVITGDYLAELTMLILWKGMQRNPDKGYATTFLRQIEEVLGDVARRGVKIVANAGGLNPAGLADDLRTIASDLGADISIAHVEGDDLLPRIDELLAGGHELANMDTGQRFADLRAEPLTANAYLGAWGIAEALALGADIVVTGRVADASLVVGPAAWHHGWSHDDWDQLAGAVAAGHVLECGAQATGGNFSFFTEIADLTHPGFPIAEVFEDGSSVITKHEGTGGSVTVGTVTAQILYEIDQPAYKTPDVVALFDTAELSQIGSDRVRISGVHGRPAPSDLKVAINYLGGFRNSMTLVLVGLDVAEKAALVEKTIRSGFSGSTMPHLLEFAFNESGVPDAPSNAAAASTLTITALDPDPSKVGRAFSSAVVELALASYPGFFALAPPAGETPYGVYWPALVPRSEVLHRVVMADGSRVEIGDPPTADDVAPSARMPRPADVSGEPTRAVPLGTLVGARSGDKGGNANIGVWVRSDEAFDWLANELTVARLQQLLPETAALVVDRYPLVNLRGLNFVIRGLLGDGVASSTRFDPQAKSLGEWLRSKVVDVPISLLEVDN